MCNERTQLKGNMYYMIPSIGMLTVRKNPKENRDSQAGERGEIGSDRK